MGSRNQSGVQDTWLTARGQPRASGMGNLAPMPLYARKPEQAIESLARFVAWTRTRPWLRDNVIRKSTLLNQSMRKCKMASFRHCASYICRRSGKQSRRALSVARGGTENVDST
jgi:hypothetical protein